MDVPRSGVAQADRGALHFVMFVVPPSHSEYALSQRPRHTSLQLRKGVFFAGR